MSIPRVLVAMAVAAAALGSASVAAAAEPFTYDPPGSLVTGSGKGRVDMNVFAPGIRFPIESGPAFANSQVWGPGGNSGAAGSSQCDKEARAYPWHDNFCETRSWDMPLCPAGTGHQGQDIRAATCQKGVHWTVAVTDGTITNVGSYSVYLTAADGTRFDYLHMEQVQVKVGDKVKRGAHMGKVSNQFGGEATTIHLHFNIHQNVAGVGAVYVPPYLSLVQSYETLMNPVPDAGPPPPPAPTKPPAVQEAPVVADPIEPPPEDVPDSGGCTFAPPSSDKAAYGGLAFALALGIIAARRRR
jgi:murein DD-endopeptidase MepM/ murein hydrolase activator NlpD